MKERSIPDHEARVKAVEEDLEYYRVKRLEPRLLHFVRRGILPLHDLLRAKGSPSSRAESSVYRPRGLEGRIAALEQGLNDYIRGIGLIAWGLTDDVDFVVEDQRKEAGTYDDFFKITKRHYRGTLEERVSALERNLRDDTAVLNAFTAALEGRGLLSKDTLNLSRGGLPPPSVTNGAKIVARAWLDEAFKVRLMAKGREVLGELGIPQGGVGRLGVVEDTDRVHNVVVCTLCSCYPYDLLGNPPWWYKHDVYKGKIVADPRITLKEMFGVPVPSSAEVRVYDSTSDIRYMVIPRRPSGTEGMDEAALAHLVTADSLIGTGEPTRSERGASAGGRTKPKPAGRARR